MTSPQGGGMTQLDALHLRIDSDFAYHPNSSDAVGDKHEAVRMNCCELAHWIANNSPASREQSLALTKLEEVMHWTNSAIAKTQFSG